MTEIYNDYRRKGGVREDPRLARRDGKTSSSNERPKQQYDKLGVPISPKQRSSSGSPSRDPRVRDTWQTLQPQNQNQNTQYNNSMQTAYQHLPPAMYTDHTQYTTQGYSTSYAPYQQTYVAQSGGYNPYQGYNQAQTGYNSGTVQPGPPGEEYPQNEWAPVTAYPNMNQAPPSHPPPVTQQISVDKTDEHKKEAVAQELKQQKAHMSKQREEYVRKVSVLRRELELLRNQKQELLAEHSPEHDNNHILRENNKLQIEISNKMKTIYNVIEMLTNIIGDHPTISELEEQCREESPKHRKEKTRRSMSSEKIDMDTKFCYIYYDPELHWCRICDVFPKSAKDYLLHLHSKEHRQITQERDMVDTPWHRLPPESELPSFEGATKKRMPIKGLQFLISATSWYCKLCDTWVGDLHCASQHLKSQNHNQNYANFVEQNPHWEIEWLRDRDKALIRTSKDKRSDSDDSDNIATSGRKSKKRKDGHSPSESKKDKKKKKHSKKRRKHSSDSSSSSSSSDSSSDDDNNDKSKSIRVAMRNKMKLQAQMIMNEDLGGKWEVLGRLVEEHKRKEAAEMGKESSSEDNLINQWMTINEPQEKDKRLFDNLKDRMKQKQEAEKARLAELEQKKREKEKQEQELREKKEKEEREAREKEEEKRRQQEELERQREKEREQIRFKTRDKYRKRSSASPSPERSRNRYSRSPSPEHRRRGDRSPDRYRRDSRYNENGRRSSDARRRSPSYDSRESPSSKRKSYKHDDKESDSRDSDSIKKDKKMQLSSHKKPHFIGRMPLFKNKKNEDKVEKEIKKEDYDIPRQSRFQPGNLARAFIPEPEVVCFPKLSCIPPMAIMIPPPPSVILPPEPPKISESPKLKAPPPPIINSKSKKVRSQSPPIDEQDMDIEDQNVPVPPPPPLTIKEPPNKEPQQPKVLPRDFQDALNLIYPDPNQMGVDPATMMQYQYNMDYNSMMYSQMYDYSQDVPAEDNVSPPEAVPVEHTMPLPPPPLPPDDPNEDLAMLGISADDMAAQMF